MPKVKVPQDSGAITITRSGETKTYRVSDGEVSVAEDDLALFMDAVSGSTKAGNPGAKK